MAISIWDKPAELKLAPLPFEMLMKAGIMKEQQYAEGEALEGSLNDELAKIGSIDIDTPDKIAELQKYKQGISSIVDKYKGDYGAMSSAFKQLQKDFNYNKNYGKLSGIINRYNKRVESVNAKLEANKEWIKSNGEKGMSPEDVRIAQQWEDANQAPLVQDPTFGTWTGYRAEDPRNSINYNIIALKYSDKITPEVLRIEAKNRRFRDAGQGYLESQDGKIKISTADFRAQVIADAMKNDDVVKNYTAWYNGITGTTDRISQVVGNPNNNFTGIDLESGLAVSRSPETASTLFDGLYNKRIYDAARSIGTLTKVYEEDIKSDYHKDWKEEYYLKKADAEEERLRSQVPAQTTNTVFSAYTNRTNPLSDIDFSKVRFGADGSVLVDYDLAYEAEGPMPDPELGTSQGILSSNAKEINAQRKKKAQEQGQLILAAVRNAKLTNPSLAGKSNAEVLNFVKTAFENGSSSFRGYTFPGMNLKDAAGFIVKDLPNQPLWINDSSGKMNGKTDLVDFADKVDANPSELAEVIKKKIEGGEADFVPVNASGKAGWRVQIGNKDGSNYEIIIPASNEAQGMFKPYSVAMDAYRSGKIGLDETKKINPNDKGVLTRLEADANGNPQWTVGRVLSLADTKANLDYNRVTTKEEAKIKFGNAVDFLPTGEMVVYDIPNLISEGVNSYSNTYLRPYVPNDQGKNYQYNASESEE
jgi:hypothetical protein